MPTKNVITTTIQREGLAKAIAGTDPLSKVVKVGFGNGGHDPVTGQPTPPSAGTTQVEGEFIKKDIDGFQFPISTTVAFELKLGYLEGNGKDVSAIGLYDTDDNLVALKHIVAKPKTQDTELTFLWRRQL